MRTTILQCAVWESQTQVMIVMALTSFVIEDRVLEYSNHTYRWARHRIIITGCGDV